MVREYRAIDQFMKMILSRTGSSSVWIRNSSIAKPLSRILSWSWMHSQKHDCCLGGGQILFWDTHTHTHTYIYIYIYIYIYSSSTIFVAKYLFWIVRSWSQWISFIMLLVCCRTNGIIIYKKIY
jgi:hypothetical protein